MFLEPVYLNETMLMNCASYLFEGVALESETVTSSEKSTKINGDIKGGVEAGFDLVGNIAKGFGNLNAHGENQQLNNLQTKIIKNVTLGSWHMKVIDALSPERLLEIQSKNLSEKPAVEYYVKIQAILKPLEFYSILEVLKLVSSQSENFISSAGKVLLKPQNGQNQNSKSLNDKIATYANIAKSLSILIDELEQDYLKSNLLEMLMVDENGAVGVLDIDVKDKNPNEIKAQLTDGEFIIFGKVVRYIDAENELNLIQRSLLSSITENLNKLMPIINLFQEDNSDFIEDYTTKANLAKIIVEQFIDLKLEGPAIRVKAMSVCM